MTVYSLYTELNNRVKVRMTCEIVLFLAAVLFTGLGFKLGYRHCVKNYGRTIIKQNIQSLIDRGYIRTCTNPDGSIEILKLDGTE